MRRDVKRAFRAASVASGLFLAVAAFAPALAEDDLAAGSGYGSDNLTFERWCGEIQKYQAERCAAHSKADDDSYHDTLLRLQAVEVQASKEQRKEREFRKALDAHDAPYRPPGQ